MIEAVAIIAAILILRRSSRRLRQIEQQPIVINVFVQHSPPGTGELQPIEEPLREDAGNVVAFRRTA